MAEASTDAMAVDQPDASIEEQKIINEEYKAWKKNAPMMYHSCYTYVTLYCKLRPPSVEIANR